MYRFIRFIFDHPERTASNHSKVLKFDRITRPDLSLPEVREWWSDVAAEAMRAADPAITLVAVGDVGRWSEGMLRNCADHMDLISEHFYVQEAPDLADHVAQVPRRIKRIADAHRRYRETIPALAGKNIRHVPRRRIT